MTQLVIPPASDADRREPAPGELELVRQLVNTYDHEAGAEDLRNADALRAWLAERGLLASGEAIGEADLQRVLEVREALRSLCLANNDGEPQPRALETLDGAARLAPVRVRFDREGGVALVPAAGGVPAALGTLLGIVFRAMSDGTWERLKACPDDDCMWAFYDHSRNRSKHWCRMEICGNRAKARSYRERHRG